MMGEVRGTPGKFRALVRLRDPTCTRQVLAITTDISFLPDCVDELTALRQLALKYCTKLEAPCSQLTCNHA